MKKALIGLGLILAATLGAASPAQAGDRYYGGGYGRYDSGRYYDSDRYYGSGSHRHGGGYGRSYGSDYGYGRSYGYGRGYGYGSGYLPSERDHKREDRARERRHEWEHRTGRANEWQHRREDAEAERRHRYEDRLRNRGYY